MTETGKLAAMALADRFERKFQDRAWKEMIRRTNAKGALIEETPWQLRQDWCNDPLHKQTYLNDGQDCPRCSTCHKKVML